jgi:hypothetical protein
MAPGGPVPTIVLVLVGAALFLLGYFQLGDCGGGYSLILFGLGVYAIGAAATPPWQSVLGAGIFGTALLLIGIIITSGAGCTL